MSLPGLPPLPGMTSGRDVMIDPKEVGPGEVGPGEAAPRTWTHRCATCGERYGEDETHVCKAQVGSVPAQGSVREGELSVLLRVAEGALRAVIDSEGDVPSSLLARAAQALEMIEADRV